MNILSNTLRFLTNLSLLYHVPIFLEYRKLSNIVFFQQGDN